MRWLLQQIIAASVTLVLTPFAQAQTTTLMRIPGDIDGDGQVNAVDQLILSRNWHRQIGPITAEVFTIDLPDLPSSSRPLRLVRIPAGSFQMGSPVTERGRNPIEEEGPLHTVAIDYDIYIGETEVTQGQWQAVMGYNPVSESDFGVGNNYPVAEISWGEVTNAEGFLGRLNDLGQGTFRLPSEAEWEYVCRAGTQTRFHFGDSLSCNDFCDDCAAGVETGNRSNYVWYCGNNSPVGRKLVGQLGANAFGVYDMHGNVQEWCEDWFHPTYNGAPNDGSAWQDPTLWRVVRGGTWYYEARSCRSAYRDKSNPLNRLINVGFRIVRLP
jgi:formylglycine-generating enzyme required for sulfatase activity